MRHARREEEVEGLRDALVTIHPATSTDRSCDDVSDVTHNFSNTISPRAVEVIALRVFGGLSVLVKVQRQVLWVALRSSRQ